MLRKFFDRFRPKTKLDDSVLVLDIGTEFVKALIYRIEERHGFVTGYAKVRQKLGDMSAGAVTDIAGVAANCELAIEQAARQAGVRPEQAVMGIAGELVRGATTTIEYEREDPTARIDLPELKSIIQRLQQRAFDAVRTELSRETGHSQIDIKHMHAAILGTQIDGIRVASPLGFQGQKVSLAVFNAFAPLVHFGALQTIAAELELDLLTIVAEPFAVAQSLATTDGEHSAIMVDVGGGTTDLALLSGGELTTKMFALGGRTFTKRLAQNFSTSFLEAEQLKLDYTKNKLDPRRQAAVRRVLVPDVEVWLAGIELALSEMSGGRPLPHKILLCGGGVRLPELKAALESSEWTASLSFRRRPSVRYLVPDDLSSFTDETGTIRDVQDVTPLALATVGLELAGTEDLVSNLLRKTVQMLKN